MSRRKGGRWDVGRRRSGQRRGYRAAGGGAGAAAGLLLAMTDVRHRLLMPACLPACLPGSQVEDGYMSFINLNAWLSFDTSRVRVCPGNQYVCVAWQVSRWTGVRPPVPPSFHCTYTPLP